MVTIDDKLKSLLNSLFNQLEGEADLGQIERVFETIEQVMKIRQMNEPFNISRKG